MSKVDVDPFQACEQCKDTPGWVVVMRQWGTMQVPSQARCKCWYIHQQKMLDAVQALAQTQRRTRKTDR